MEHTDHHVGRLIDTLKDLQILDDTLIYLIIGDNGASAEGTPNGTFSELLVGNGFAALETPEFLIEHIDKFGTPEAYNHYAVGWAHATDTPYQWTKRWRRHCGGRAMGRSSTGPRASRRRRIRSQFSHVIDVARTILEVAGLPQPTIVNSVQQAPIEGVGMATRSTTPRPRSDIAAVFRDVLRPGNLLQGLERRDPAFDTWVFAAKLPAFDDGVWGLYDGNKDGPGARSGEGDAGEAAQLRRLWLNKAVKYNVYRSTTAESNA